MTEYLKKDLMLQVNMEKEENEDYPIMDYNLRRSKR